MDRERMKAFHCIMGELKRIRKDIRTYQKKAERSGGKLMTDVARGSSPEFPYTETRMKIEKLRSTRRRMSISESSAVVKRNSI